MIPYINGKSTILSKLLTIYSPSYPLLTILINYGKPPTSFSMEPPRLVLLAPAPAAPAAPAAAAAASAATWRCHGRGRCYEAWVALGKWRKHAKSQGKNGSLNVPIEHHPTIRYMVYHGYYKVMWYMVYYWYMVHGYGSIPINTISRGMNIHKSQLFWCELQGYKVLTHCQMTGN